MGKQNKAEKEPDVIITVSGGVADVEKIPAGLTVQIKDFDVEGCDEKRLSKDENGDFFISSIFETE